MANPLKIMMKMYDCSFESRYEPDDRVRSFIIPKRIIWKTGDGSSRVENEEVLLERKSNQITLKTGRACRLENHGSNA